jgi:hypothetical protein
VNQSVHSCISGCFTLKLSGSWKTVIASPFVFPVFSSAVTAGGGVFSSVSGRGAFSATAAILMDEGENRAGSECRRAYER